MITFKTTATIQNKQYKFELEWTPNRMILKIIDVDTIWRHDSNQLVLKSDTSIEHFFNLINNSEDLIGKKLIIVLNYFKIATNATIGLIDYKLQIRDCPICNTCKHIYIFHPIFDDNLIIDKITL